MRTWVVLPLVGGALALGLLANACGGGSDSPTAPTPPPTGGPTVNSLSLAITSGGLSAPSGDLAVGGTVTVTNNDAVPHEMSSDPHPAHTNCPGLNFGSLNPGQSRTSPALTAARSCGIHDHMNPGSQSLMRTIVIR
jgi:hypothetical protein